MNPPIRRPPIATLALCAASWAVIGLLAWLVLKIGGGM